MARFTRAEGIRIRDLIGNVRLRRGRNVFAGIGYYLLVFPCFSGREYAEQLAGVWLDWSPSCAWVTLRATIPRFSQGATETPKPKPNPDSHRHPYQVW